MSHRMSIDTKIKNKVSLENALKRLGISYKTNAETKSVYIDSEKCDIVLDKYGKNSLNDAVGLKLSKDGSYELVGDFYQLHDNNNKSFNHEDLNNRITNAYNFEEVNSSLSNMGFNCNNTNIDFNKEEVNFVMQRMV